jgi:hypothetical protein
MPSSSAPRRHAPAPAPPNGSKREGGEIDAALCREHPHLVGHGMSTMRWMPAAAAITSHLQWVGDVRLQRARAAARSSVCAPPRK